MGFWANLFGSGRSSSSINYDEAFLWLGATGSAEAVKNAIASGKNANEKDKDGKTALMYAAESNGDEEVLGVLIKAGANVSARNNKGNVALHFAAVNKNCNPKIIDTILNAGSLVDVRNNEGLTPLMRAVHTKFNNSMNINALTSSGADVEATFEKDGGINPSNGMRVVLYLSVLAWAINSNNAENVRAVLEAGAYVNMRLETRGEINGNFVSFYSSPLITAVMMPGVNIEMLKLLLDAGADINAKDSAGFTALKFAKQNNDAEAAKVLEARGAML